MAETAPGAPKILTFGCRLNVFESEVMRGLAGAGNGRATIIVNTCAVTAEAERQARQAIRKARRADPDARIVVTGCAAQVSPDRFAAMPEVDHVLGNAEKLRAESWLALESSPRVAVGDVFARPPGTPGPDAIPSDAAALDPATPILADFGTRTRAFVQVQNGCDHRCTFCIIPYGRGPSRSLPVGAVAAQVRALVESGYREVVLTGVDLTAYGPDLPGQPTLGQMVRRVLAQVPELARLRLSSIDVAEVDADLMRLIAEEPRLMPHLHLSLQAGDDLTLKRMKRRHTRAQAIAFCESVRRLRPDVAFGADLIAGFPTETEAMFDATLRLVEDCGLVYLHVFPFSARASTPAARMPQLPVALRRERAARLRASGEAALARYLRALVGVEQSVLVETVGDGSASGRGETYAPVRLAALARQGEIRRVRATSVRDGELLAEAA
ncbi:MAG: tRNA (N(6)-L-threonylcarbamoyladenosine(37)-C(2))-methylthiotransferase MtaB [Alphaproteobacteria bacterium]|nr:tRNA (N(6)-L-threonylcarbamoyladenosine(37)-C(2))-methylthiotransferase MtaB [Alphaproteobacteria bacterium]